MTRDLIVGLLFLGAIFLVGMMTFMLGGFGGASEYALDVQFEDVGGLQEGDAVRVRGVKFGEIDKVQFSEEEVTVTLRLKDEIVPKDGYIFEVLPSGPLGGSYLRYNPGKGAAVATTDLTGKAGGDLFTTINEILSENRANIRNSIGSLESILATIDDGKGVISALFRDSSMKDDFAQSLSDLKSITGKIDRGEGVLGAAISDPQMKNDVEATVTGIRSAIDHVNAGEGAVGALIYGTEIKSQLERIFDRADRITQDIENAKGLLGALLNEPTLKQYFEDFARGAANLMTEIRSGEGVLAALIGNSEIRDSVKSAIIDIAAITDQVRTGKGTLNSLIYHTDLYENLNEAASLLRDATEDAREQAPISTFFGILFAPF